MKSVFACFVLCGLALPAQAGEVIQLANHPALAPDGSTLAFDWNGEIWSVPTAGGAARQLTQHPASDREPFFSPDGKQIAFISTREGASQVFTMPAPGGLPKQLSFHTAGAALQGWTPDGQQLLISATRDHDWRRFGSDRFFLISSTGRSPEQLLFDDYGQNGNLSPDGRKLLFTREGTQWWRKGYVGSQASQIWLFDRDQKSFRKILDPESGALWPLWKPDGKGFYYVGGQSGCFNLREHDLATGQDRQLTQFKEDSVVTPCISRDGKTLVFRNLFDLYRYRPESGQNPEKIVITCESDRMPSSQERRTLTTASAVAFTSDGLEVAFIAGGDLWVMDTELREPRAITRTAEEERSPIFAPDNESILFISEALGKSDIYRAEKKDKSLYWFQNEQFALKRLTNDGAFKAALSFSPDGKQIAYLRNRGELWIADAEGKNGKLLVSSFSPIEYDWSPDGKWMVISKEDHDFNRDIFILPIDGSRPPYNVSRSPNNDGDPVWSPDGKMIAYVGKHSGTETDVHYVWLRSSDDQATSRERSVEKALEKLNRVRKPAGPVGQPKSGTRPPMSKDGSEPKAGGEPKAAVEPKAGGEPKAGADATASPAETRPTARPAALPEVVIDFEKLSERVKVIPITESEESNLFWSPDGKKLAFTATVGGQRGTYYVEFPDGITPKQLTTNTGTQARWLKTNNQIVWLSGGVPAAFTPSTSGGSAPSAASALAGLMGRRGLIPSPAAPAAPSAPAASSDAGYRFQALQMVDLPKRHAAAFDLAWRIMRDQFYDENLNNRDWNAVRAKYSDMARRAPDLETLATVINLMLGELNGSHLGFMPMGSSAAQNLLRRGRGGPGAEPAAATWSESTLHPGVRFDFTFPGPGLKVRDVIPNGPADKNKTRILPGEIVLEINGTKVDPNVDLSSVLTLPPGQELTLKVKAADGKERTLILPPISYAQAKQLLYEKWLDDNRKAVDKLSGGKLGYIHIDAMSMPSFYKFEKELSNAGAGKDGLVIDVRENGGGSTADHLLTALSQPVHAITVPRGGGPGYPQDRVVYATWNKPIVVLCNQNSFSNAEIFSHAIKTLKRGKLVGVPTAGGVLSTGATTIMDLGLLRLPFRGWYTLHDGEDMELNGARPDVIVWPVPAMTPPETDAQLSKAVEVLLSDVEAWKARPKPPLRKASERKK